MNEVLEKKWYYIMQLDNNSLIDFLIELESELDRRITIIAIGGTAMTLLNLKPSTIDVDFIIPDEYYDEFIRALNAVPHGFHVHHWKGNMVFSQILPDDYIEKSITIKTKTKKIELRALHPLDIVATKIGRLNDRDLQDIEVCIKKYHLTEDQIVERARKVEYVGREENYLINLEYIVRKFFHKNKA